MAHAFFFLCPHCYAEDTLTDSACTQCRTPIRIREETIFFNGRVLNSEQYYQLLQDKLTLTQAPSALKRIPGKTTGFSRDSLLRISGPALLRQGRQTFFFRGYHRLFGMRVEKPVKLAKGRLLLYPDSMAFHTSREVFTWHIGDVTCVTTNGHYFEFKIRKQPFYQILFKEESPLKYQLLLRKWLDEFYRQTGRGKIVEYQPRVRVKPPETPRRFWNIPEPATAEKARIPEKAIMGAVAFVLRTLLRLWIRVRIYGREHWHKGERGIVLVNHQSVLDPFIIGAYFDRGIAFLTKSTSFAHWLPRTFLKWAMAIPTTRYQTDPAVIVAVRALLRRGIRVGVFPEGERCWDGAMQHFKLNLVRMLMASREAIYPMVIRNAYHFFPRWAKFPRRATIALHLQPPFCLLPIYSVDEQRRFLEERFRAVLTGLQSEMRQS